MQDLLSAAREEWRAELQEALRAAIPCGQKVRVEARGYLSNSLKLQPLPVLAETRVVFVKIDEEQEGVSVVVTFDERPTTLNSVCRPGRTVGFPGKVWYTPFDQITRMTQPRRRTKSRVECRAESAPELAPSANAL